MSGKIKIVINGMILQENYFKNLNINSLDQENNVDKDGLIIQIHVKKEVNGNNKKINSLLAVFLTMEEDGVIQLKSQVNKEQNIWLKIDTKL